MANPIITVNISMTQSLKDIHFIVKNATLQPLANAQINLFQNGQNVADTTTDATGTAVLGNVPAGQTYQFTCDLAGYTQVTGTFST